MVTTMDMGNMENMDDMAMGNMENMDDMAMGKNMATDMDTDKKINKVTVNRNITS